jgi:hypothetical protein
MILLRGIFRTIEFGSGNNSRGYFLDNEGWCTSYSPPTPQNLLMRCMNRLRTRNAAHPHLRVPLPLFSPLALHSFRPQGPTAPRGGDSTHRSEPRSQEIPGRRPRVEVRRSLVPFLLPYSATSSPPHSLTGYDERGQGCMNDQTNCTELDYHNSAAFPPFLPPSPSLSLPSPSLCATHFLPCP